VLDRLDIPLPIIQAPMAGVSTPALAAAVSNAGGLGSIAIGSGTLAQAREAIGATRALTARPFQVNVFCHAPARRDPAVEAAWIRHMAPLFAGFGASPPAELREIYPSFIADEAMLRLLLETRPAVVSFHFGLPPREWIAALRDAGIATLATATHVDEALAIEAAGVDGIVAQGIEAGGHRGLFDPQRHDESLPMSVLVRRLCANTRLPVIAAGGIMDGHGIRAALDLGAVAAQLGTAFVPCPESAASPAHREALLDERGGRTRLTPVLSGRPARGIPNRYVAHGEAPGSPPPPAYPVAYDLARQLAAIASRQGHPEVAAHWAGQGAPLARPLPAAELVDLLARELRAET